MQKGAYLNTEYLGIFLNGDDQIVKNKWLRKAINYGFDRKMITYLRNELAHQL